jgi:hypothetical protein
LAKLKDLSVSFLSLVKTPATGKGLTLKSAKPGERASTFEIVKTDDERMVAYGIVYAPDQEDAHGDTASADTIRKACYEFMREGRLKNIDTEHSFTNESAYVCECWLVRKGDELFPSEPEGAWAVGIRIGDPDLWKQLKSGELTGISLAGIARMEPEPDDPAHPRYTEKDAAPGWFTSWLKSMTGVNPTTPKETDMDKNEVQEIVRDTLKSELGDAITTALKSAGIGDQATPKDPEPTEVEKAVAAALKAAGIEPKTPAAENGDGGDGDPAEGGETDIEKAIAKALGGFEAKLDDKITKALAKGVTETDPASGVKSEESFL